MRPLLIASLLASLMLTLAPAPSNAQDKESTKPRKYKHDFEGQDLSNRDFSRQNLDDANFTDAVLTNAKFKNSSLKNCSFQGAILRDTDLSYADLTGSDLRNSTFCDSFCYLAILNKADLSGLDLKGRNTAEMKFREAKLVGTKGFNQIYGSDFFMADLRGADFSTAVLLDRTNFRKAKYDQITRWPNGFEIKNQGLLLVETKPEEDEEPKRVTPTSNKSNNEAAFQKLDKNEDGVLSGSEMKGLDAKDADGDGEVSLAEFLGMALKRDSEMPKGKPSILGVWQAVSIEQGGNKAPAEMAKLLRMTFRKDALIVRGNHKDEKEDRCSYKIDDSKTPKQFEFSMDGEPASVLGIYRIENGILEICTRRPETKLGRPDSFDASKDDSIVHMKLERLDSE